MVVYVCTCECGMHVCVVCVHMCMVCMCAWCTCVSGACVGVHMCVVCVHMPMVYMCVHGAHVSGACVCMGHAQVDLSLLDSSREMNGLFLRSGNDRQRALANTSGVNPGAARLPVLALDPVAGGGAPQGPHAAGTASVGHLVIGVSMKTSLQA